MLLFIATPAKQAVTHMSFNTSHVTLYPNAIEIKDTDSKFQYISCYSLSRVSPSPLSSASVSIHLMLLFIVIMSASCCSSRLFQYISCYSLSNLTFRKQFRNDRFNTSHVTLYQTFQCRIEQCFSGFNTSHVTLYQVSY